MAASKDLAFPEETRRRVLLFGWGPLPFEDARMHYAPCARLWQFAEPLARDGHHVSVVAVTMAGTVPDTPPFRLSRDGVMIQRCGTGDLKGAEIRSFVEASEADLVIGVSPRPASWALPFVGERPLIVDLFGDPMAEAQAQELVFPGEERQEAYRNLLAELLEAGDAFATVSDAHINVLIGQLGLAGRLTADLIDQPAAGMHSETRTSLSCGIPIFSIPCALPAPRAVEERLPFDLPSDAFVILSSGGFNTWVDVDTLFAGLERAMELRNNIYFVATGGSIPGQDEESFNHWQDHLQRSQHQERYLMPGFLSSGELSALIRRANLGLVCEKNILERRLGSSGRITHWLGEGLPVVCTRLSELGRVICSRGLGRCYQPGDPAGLASLLIELSGSHSLLTTMSAAGQSFARTKLSAEETTRPLRQWINGAKKLPASRRRSVSRMVALLDELERLRAELDLREARIHALQAELGEIHHSRMWRWWMSYLDIRGTLLKFLSGPRRR